MMLVRVAVSVACGFALIPVWKLGNSWVAQLGIIVGLAGVFYLASVLIDAKRQRR
jgi:hypothetical protein